MKGHGINVPHAEVAHLVVSVGVLSDWDARQIERFMVDTLEAQGWEVKDVDLARWSKPGEE